MPKSLKQPSHRAKKRKYDHDLTCVRKFSSSVSQLIPVFYDLAYPGDRYDFRTEMFTQLREIVSPAMTHITEHVEWFFVPLKQISQLAPDSIFGIQDYHTTFVDNANNTKGRPIPLFNAKALVNDIVTFDESLDYQDIDLDEEIDPLATTSDNLLRCDVFGIPHYFNVQRLSQMLGFGTLFVHIANQYISNDKSLLLNPMFACAYQKIWFDCFRIDNRIANDARYYNLDKYAVAGVVHDFDASLFFSMRYRPWKLDFFTSLLPSPLIDYGSIGMQSDQGGDLSLVDAKLYVAQNLNENSANKTINLSEGNLSLGNLRGAFAVEKLMEITRRADKNYNAQVLAHFGFEVPKGILDHVYRLAKESTVVNIDEVFATADGSNGVSTTSLGQKGGRASAYMKPMKNPRFTAPCHGIIMALFSAVPNADYSNFGVDRLNTYDTRQDYWQPELDKLSMQPCFGYQIFMNGLTLAINAQNTILGWQFRYQESKVKINLCSGIFTYNESFKSWTTQRDLFTDNDSFAGLTYQNVLHWSFYYIDPCFIDSIMLLQFKPTDNMSMVSKNVWNRDPLLHWFKFYVHKASEISNYSLPSL